MHARRPWKNASFGSLHIPCHFIVAAVALTASAFAQSTQDKPGPSGSWPQLLGPQRNGISTETDLLDAWPEGGPPEVWRVAGGVGMSGIAIDQGRAITMLNHDGQQWVIALDALTGKTLWRTAVAPAYENAMGNGPRATPTIAGDSVYALTGEGILAALAVADGQTLWKHNVLQEHEGEPAEYGMASSPLLAEDKVIIIAGAPNATLVAYDRHTGELAWQAGDDPAGYSSPVLRTLGGQPQVVAFTGKSAIGVAAANGRQLWRYPFETDYHCNIALPLELEGDLLLSAGENHGCVRLALTGRPKELEFDVAEIWTSFGNRSTLRSEWQTAILWGDYLYGFDNVGSAGPVTHLTCVDARTGKRMWQEPRFGKGNLIAADGKLLMTMMTGELVMLRANPQRYEPLARAMVLGATRQAPSLADGRLYVRDDSEIVCLRVRD